MNQQISIGLGMLAGVAIGAAAVQGLHAQAKPPGYLVFNNEITDMQGYQPVVDGTPKTFAPYGARFLIRPTMPEVLEGAKPNRFGVIAFDSVEKAREWYNSPANKELNAIRARTAKNQVFIIEGATN
jgi:uncharacterized protein (DUF1330 family)